MHSTFAFTYALGIIFFVIGIAILLNKKNYAVIIEDITRNQGLLWLDGIVTLITGALFIGVSHVWLIVLIGWLAIIKGVYILLFPDLAASFYKKCTSKSSLFVIAGIISIILGLILLL